jgi:hypothetical protein
MVLGIFRENLKEGPVALAQPAVIDLEGGL